LYSGSIAQKVLLPQLDHAQVDLPEEFAADLVNRFLGAAVVVETMRQRTAREKRDVRIALLDRFEQRLAEAPAFVELMPHAPAGDRHDLEVLVGVHVAHRHERAVFEFEAVDLVRAGRDPALGGRLGDQPAERRVARIGVLHVADEMRQLVARIRARELRIAVHVIAGVDEPVHVRHDDRVDAERAAALADQSMAADRRFAAAVMPAGQFRQVHRRHVRDLRGEGQFAHRSSLLSVGVSALALTPTPCFAVGWS
jgi:hypothetical protein